MISTNAKIFNQNKKRNTILLITGLTLLFIALFLIYLGIQNENQKLPLAKNMNELVKERSKEVNLYAYTEINIKPYLFAVYEENGKEEKAKYYLAMDKDNRLYILYMSDEDYKKIEKKENSIKVKGITKKISNDIKTLAISAYNEVMNDEYLTKDNFEEYVGYLYLDMYSKIYDSLSYYLGASIIGIFSIIIICFSITIMVKTKKAIKTIGIVELSRIDTELSQLVNSEYQQMKFYMLKDYIIDFGNNIVIIPYKDIICAYSYEKRYNGLLVNKYIKIITNKNQKEIVASTKLLDKNKDDILQTILTNLKEKNENIIIGYNKENKKIVKEKLKRTQKKKKKFDFYNTFLL